SRLPTDVEAKQSWTAEEHELTVRFVQKHGDLPAPSRAHDDDAGWDLAAAEALTIMPHMQELIAMGLQVAIPPGCYLRIALCPGLAVCGIDVKAGVVDASFCGEISAVLQNSSKKTMKLGAGEKAAQLVVIKIAKPQTVRVKELRATSRGTGGFGSTGR
ncbi:dUTP diphosphatase, partial [Coemansia reversa NRRL 1564]